ncbi:MULTISPECIES: hypothetical protein [unclassified Streptomyces]|uniref:hypothetical protein n=1 Tax=unclassified Streptomyces TaxID=2593676 RepID=UPI0033320BF7
MTTETDWSGPPPVPRLADAGKPLQVYGMTGPHKIDAFLRSVREALDRLAARAAPAARTETLRGAIRKEL